MRLIKFRAWDKINKKMVKSHRFLIAGTGKVYKVEDPMELVSYPSFVLMQFTGLKDKNGKEIYEGDILRYGYSKKTGIIYDVYIPNSVVKWNDEIAGFELNKESVEDMYEAIGNIYENPDLLKEQ